MERSNKPKVFKQASAILCGDIPCFKRTKYKNAHRIGTQGRYSKYWLIWNTYNPDDLILPNTGFVIHHKDGNPNHNEIENLQKMGDVEHKKHHCLNGNSPNQGKTFSKEIRDKLSKSHIGQIPWNKGKTGIYSEETKIKIGSGRRGKPSNYGMLGKKHSEETKQKMRGRIPWNKIIK